MSKRERAPNPKGEAPKPEAPRSNRARAVAELLPAVGGAAFRRFGFVQSAIVSRWPDIVGAKLSAASVPESIRFPVGRKQDGTLTLTVRGAHAPMLQHVVPEIIDRVNRFFGYAAVARVQIRQGEVAAAAPRKAPPSLKPAPAQLPGDLGDGLRAIVDPELRAVLESLAAGVAATRGLPRLS